MKRSLGFSERIRQVLGAAVLAGVAVIALGLDTGLLSQISYASTASFEQRVLDRLHTAIAPEVAAAGVSAAAARSELPVEGKAPSLDGAVEWLNSPPLTREQLRGKVVLIDFWTYSCINCIRTIPYVRAWADKYRDQGLVVIGVHAPEFAFEKKIDNVRQAVARFKIDYPVAIDNDYRIWRAFDNSYWPAHYLIDARGQIRYHHFGEDNYRQTEEAIQDLLREAGSSASASAPVSPQAAGAEAGADIGHMRSGETYIGYRQARSFASNEAMRADTPRDYSVKTPSLNEWGLSGTWTVGAEAATLDAADGGITYRFSARDLHLVLGRMQPENRFVSRSPSTGIRRVRIMAPTRMPRAMASSPQPVFTSSSASPAPSKREPLPSASSTPACRPMPSLSADPDFPPVPIKTKGEI